MRINSLESPKTSFAFNVDCLSTYISEILRILQSFDWNYIVTVSGIYIGAFHFTACIYGCTWNHTTIQRQLVNIKDRNSEGQLKFDRQYNYVSQNNFSETLYHQVFHDLNINNFELNFCIGWLKKKSFKNDSKQ